jgi:PAS domain S-box-containing protein
MKFISNDMGFDIESLRILIDEYPSSCCLWKKEGDNFILLHYNEKAAKKESLFLKRATLEGILDFYDEYKLYIEGLKICFETSDKFTKILKDFPSGELTALKFVYIPSKFIMVKNLSESKKKEISLKDKDKNPPDSTFIKREGYDKAKKVKDPEERYRLIFDMVPDLILTNDTNGNITDANKATIESLGIKLNELKQMNLAQIYHRNNQEEVEKALRNKGWGEPLIGQEIQLTDYQGNKLIYEVNAVPFREKGKPRQILNIARDITERKKIEQKLRESNEILKTIFEQTFMTIMIIQDEEIKFRNAHFGKITGHSPKETKNWTFKDIFKLVHPKDKKFVYEQYRKKVSGEKDIVPHYEFRAFNKQGEVIWIETFSKTITYNERPAAFVTLIDKTEKKKAEMKLKEMMKETQNAYKKATFFKDLFTHDINNIIQSIQSSTELISIYKNDKNKFDEIIELNEIIKGQTLRAKKLIENIQKLNEVEDSQIPLKKVNLCHLLKEAIIFVKEGFQNRKINIDVDSFSEKIEVMANSLLLDVFENILINSVKYNNNHLVEIEIKIIKPNEDNNLRIEFRDNGVGIRNEDKEKIFKSSLSHDDKHRGMGLGLKLVKKIIKSYEGKIWVEDKVTGMPSKGSNFIVEIPY